jgi:hypothetical protein
VLERFFSKSRKLHIQKLTGLIFGNLVSKVSAMKTFICSVLLSSISVTVSAQSIIGSWQLVKQTTCLEGRLTAQNDSAQLLVEDMKSMSTTTPSVVTFKEKLTGEESTRILTRKKTSNNKSFIYKFDGELLMILDKKSQTITDNYLVEKFSADSLVLSNVSRPCETKILLRIKG